MGLIEQNICHLCICTQSFHSTQISYLRYFKVMVFRQYALNLIKILKDEHHLLILYGRNKNHWMDLKSMENSMKTYYYLINQKLAQIFVRPKIFFLGLQSQKYSGIIQKRECVLLLLIVTLFIIAKHEKQCKLPKQVTG